MIKESVVYPEKIIYEQGVKDSDNLLIKEKKRQIGINERKVTVFSAGAKILLDFGKEVKACFEALTVCNDNARIHVRYGESIAESMSELGVKNATNDHSLRDFFISPPNYSDQTYMSSGFRYIYIEVKEGTWIVKNLVVKSQEFVRKPLYLYQGNDEKIQEIFQTAKRTIDLCACSDYVWDGIKRDRLVWYGDLHPEMLALTSLYGRTKQVENSIELGRREYPLPHWMNFFPSYSMWWIIVVCDYYDATGCKAFTKRQLRYMIKLLAQMNDFVDENGEMKYPDYFTDWPTYETEGAKEGVRAIHILAVSKAVGLLQAFGYDTELAKKLLQKLKCKRIRAFDQKQIIALKCLAENRTTKEDYARLIKGGSQGFSTFMSYYILQAIAAYDREKAIELMKEYFDKMLSLGATTFWEDFDVTWAENVFGIDEMPTTDKKDIHGDFGAYCYKGFRHSLCQGWSSGVIKFIKDNCVNEVE